MSTSDAYGFYSLGARSRLRTIRRVVLVGSGKGGVGKSLVAAGLAVSLVKRGKRVAVFDIDVHGASVPSYFALSPPLRSSAKGIEPETSAGVSVMSVGLLTGSRPVPVRGGLKEGMITELFALTNWGRLDYLVVDMPPSTGDELLTALRLFGAKSSLILVTTPSEGAVSVVARLAALARSERVPVKGAVVNMAYMVRGAEKVFPFGRATASLARSLGTRTIVEIPLDPKISSHGLLSVMSGRGPVPIALGVLADCILNPEPGDSQ